MRSVLAMVVIASHAPEARTWIGEGDPGWTEVPRRKLCALTWESRTHTRDRSRTTELIAGSSPCPSLAKERRSPSETHSGSALKHWEHTQWEHTQWRPARQFGAPGRLLP